jgi:hypothetical protein
MMKRKNAAIWVIVLFITAVLRFYESTFAVLTVMDVVEQVSQANYTNYLDNTLYTHLGDDRGTGPEHDLAQNNIYAEFESFGLDTALHGFEYGGSTFYNVVGAHYGTVRPTDYYIVGAHYDSVYNPGADDNASGTAGIMEAARVLSQYEFEATLLFIAFDREEQGLYGSTAYAEEHSSDNILGMVSLDMISYNGSGSNKARIYSRDSSAPLKQSLADAIDLYGNGLSGVDSGMFGGSDHEPFQEQGFQACLLIEYDFWSNPYYHTLYDSVDMPGYIDYYYATNMVRSAVGFLATDAVLIPEPATLLLLGFGAVMLGKKFKGLINPS